MTQAEIFLSAFNEIERYIKRKLKFDSYARFAYAVRELEKTDRVVRKFKDDLLEYAELRNAIVHSRGKNEVIAFPTEKAVNDLVRIKNTILDPPIIKSLFGKQVITVDETESLSSTLGKLRKYEISQLPVIRDNTIIEIINGNTIAMWLSKQDIISTTDSKVGDLIDSVEKKKNFRLISERTDIYTCAEIFSASLHKGWYMDAILFSNSGRAGEGLTGIIVLEDIAVYLT